MGGRYFQRGHRYTMNKCNEIGQLFEEVMRIIGECTNKASLQLNMDKTILYALKYEDLPLSKVNNIGMMNFIFSEKFQWFKL